MSKRYGRQVQSFKKRMGIKDSLFDKIADFLTHSFGTVTFLILNAIFFFLWILVNTNRTPLEIFDPFPFGLLTMIVSLEAIFLTIIILISQNRAGHIDYLRDEVDFEIDIQAEDEITKILNILDEIHDHLGLKAEDDNELALMKQKTDIRSIRDRLLRKK
jgi:uncharacterized membrane protein